MSEAVSKDTIFRLEGCVAHGTITLGVGFWCENREDGSDNPKLHRVLIQLL